jgi:hypothetical protein
MDLSTCIDDESKTRILEAFKGTNSSIRFLFTTTAFGMGIEIKEIRVAVHLGVENHVSHDIGRVLMVNPLPFVMHLAVHLPNK